MTNQDRIEKAYVEFGKSFSVRRNVLNLTMTQWKIADSLNLSSITPRDWIQAIGARGGFLTGRLTDEEREFVRIVYLPNALELITEYLPTP